MSENENLEMMSSLVEIEKKQPGEKKYNTQIHSI